MAPNRKQVTLLCESIDIQDLRVVHQHPKVALQQQQQQLQQREQAVTNSDSYWEWTSPDVHEDEPPSVEEEPKVVDFFSVDRIVSNLVAAASAKNEPAKAAATTLPSSDDYWSERDYASGGGTEKTTSLPLHQQGCGEEYAADYWQWSQEPSESDNYWRPEQPSCAAAAPSADDDDMMKYYWNEAPTTMKDGELVQGYWDWSSAEPATESDSYWHWNNSSATAAAEAPSRQLILSA